jgi:hypothetical protein
MGKAVCDEDVAIFCEKIARQLRFVAAALERGDDGEDVAGGADILELLAGQCEGFAVEFAGAGRRCQQCQVGKEFFKIADFV